MPRRPPQLELAQPTAEEEKLKITDTMTLVVAGNDGRELRVKESGLHPGETAPTPTDRRTEQKCVSVLNKIAFDDLRIGDVLGVGSQGRVRRVQHKKTGKLFALKSINFSDDKEATRLAVHHELIRIEALKHPHVVSSYEAYFREGKLYVLMELMDAGTMAGLIKKRGSGLPESYVAKIAVQFLQGLAHLHASNVVHRDIKPANLLANSRGEVKISDFGVAGDSSKIHMTSVGSTPYMSPERIQSQPYTTSCDIWSAGMTLAELAMGTYPFGDVKGKVFELCQLIAGNHVVPRWELSSQEFTPELKDFIVQCLLPVDQRPSAVALMQHPFLKDASGEATPELGKWFVNPVDA